VNARLPKALFLFLAVCATAYFWHCYPQLTSIVASHFDRHGIANGWETKQTFFEIFAGMTLLSAVVVFGLPKIIAPTPRQFIHLPNKEYWLGPEQWAASMEFLSAWFAWFGCAAYAVIIAAFDYAIQSNLHSPGGLNPARLGYVLVLFAAFAVVWAMRFRKRFGRLPRGPSK
jgi:hypothetical protein